MLFLICIIIKFCLRFNSMLFVLLINCIVLYLINLIGCVIIKKDIGNCKYCVFQVDICIVYGMFDRVLISILLFLQNGYKRVYFQETYREIFIILKIWKFCFRLVEEMCVFDVEFSEDGEEFFV